jgi:hypothetical protein
VAVLWQRAENFGLTKIKQGGGIMSHPFVDIICAKTPEQKAAAEARLALSNASALSDREVMQNFLKDCATLDGKPVSLD